MIRSFRGRDAELTWLGERSKRLSAAIQRVALKKLRQLDAAAALGDMRIPPGNRLELLRGDRWGQHSIRINDQWRICFVWREGDA